jgi:hypothetical protein
MKSTHLSPVKSYTAVFAALLGLTLTTTAVSLIDLGSLNVVVALTIAIGKALLVLLYFMHGCLPGQGFLVRDSDHFDHERCAYAQLSADRRSIIQAWGKRRSSGPLSSRSRRAVKICLKTT